MKQLIKLNFEFIFVYRCFYATSVPYQMIVFEDLREAGFIMADRNDGLDKAHCALMLKHLAKLHASSYVLGIKQPEYMEKFNFGLLKSDMDESAAVASLLNKGVTTLAEVSEKWPGYEKISNKLNGIGVRVNKNRIASIDSIKMKFIFSSICRRIIRANLRKKQPNNRRIVHSKC